MPGLTDEEKKYILECETQIVALRFLQARKSQLAIKAARWKDIYQAQLDVAQLEKKIADLDSARKKVIVVAVTGLVSCAGSFVISGLLARAGGYAYTSFSMAAPLVATSVQSGGFTVVTAIPLTQSIAARLGWFALKTAIFGAPAGYILKKTIGESAFSLALAFAFEKSGYKAARPYSPEEFAKAKELFISDRIGDERFRRIISDTNSREQEIKDAIQQIVNMKVAGYIAETLMGMNPPISMLMLMADDEIAGWYSKFREDVAQYIQKEYASLSREDLSILQNQLLWDFWNQISVDLNSLDMKWHQDARTLQRSANDTVLNMRRLLEMMNQPAIPGRR